MKVKRIRVEEYFSKKLVLTKSNVDVWTAPVFGGTKMFIGMTDESNTLTEFDDVVFYDIKKDCLHFVGLHTFKMNRSEVLYNKVNIFIWS